MITDFILNMLFSFPLSLVSKIPDVDNISIPENTLNNFLIDVELVSHIFPFHYLTPIITISFALSVFKILWALGLRVKSFIPTMGA